MFFVFDQILGSFRDFFMLQMGCFWSQDKVQNILGSKHLFSRFPSILSFDFDLISGYFLLFVVLKDIFGVEVWFQV